MPNHRFVWTTLDTAEIPAAILAHKDDPERRAMMSQACLMRTKEFDVNERARRMAEWMRELAG